MVYMITWAVILSAIYVTFDQYEKEQHAIIDDGFTSMFEFAVERHVAVFSSVLETLSGKTDIIDALDNQNREYLLNALTPEYKFLNEALEVTHLYSLDKNGQVITRQHNREVFGDKVSRYQPLIDQNIRHTVHTVSIGKLGSLSLRVMKPVYSNNQLKGFIELGENVDVIWNIISKRIRASVFILVHKKHLTEEKWRQGKKAFGWPSNWEDYGDYAIVGGTNYKNMLDGKLGDYLEEALTTDQSFLEDPDIDLHYDILPLKESTGNEIGLIVLAYPHDVLIHKTWKFIEQAMAISAIAMIIGMYFCYLFLRPVATSIEERRNTLEKEVIQHTAKLAAAKEEAVKARDEAETASKAKSDFLSNMSHELRTPLNAIIGFSSVIMDDQFRDGISDRYKDYAQDINTSGHHLLTLINEVLDVSRVEAGELKLYIEELSLNDVLQESQQMVNGRATEKVIPISCALLDEEIVIEADHTRLKQIVLNLLTNAIKFTVPPGAIRILVNKPDTSTVEIVIDDDGIGVPENEMATVLRRFGRAASGDTKREGEEGAGLGLTLVQDLVALHQGSFEFKSKVGRGTQAKVILPLKYSSPEA